ncbi:MAG: Conjugal transfer protein TraG [Myxococcaceae bacterium]|nr:Conjugal transfer protein TraG [Myxococcaceae bacterium]
MKYRNYAQGPWGLKRATRFTPKDLAIATMFAALVWLVLSSALTQWFARELAYRNALGQPWFSLQTFPVYAPWSWQVWRSAIAAHFPDSVLVLRTDSAQSTLLVLALSVFAYCLLDQQRKRGNRIDEVHGSGHLAQPAEVQSSGLLGHAQGVFLAHWIEPARSWFSSARLRYLRHVGATHSLVSGPPRCGKDAGNLLPTALDAQPDQSILITDPKGDAWKLSSGYRASQGHRVLRFAPSLEPHLSAHMNPLAGIRIGTYREIADAQLLATSYLNGDGLSFKGNNGLFARAARPLFVASLLHVLYRERALGAPVANIGHVVDEFLSSTRPFDEVLREWLAFEHDPDYSRGWKTPEGQRTKTHPMVASSALAQLTCADKKLRANVQFCITTALELFYDPCLRDNLSTSDFSVADLVEGDRPTALYLVYPPSDRERLAPIFRILLEQLFQRLTEEMAVKNGQAARPHKYKLLLLLNEFAQLGRMDTLEAALPICPSYGIQAMLYVQQFAQLRAAYGDEETLSGQCAIRVFYPPNSFDAAEEISAAIGKTTAVSRTPRQGRQQQTTERETTRDVLSPDEILRMPGPTKVIDEHGEERIRAAGDVIVFKTGTAPIYARQILFWEDPVLLARSQLAPPLLTTHPPPERARVTPPMPAPPTIPLDSHEACKHAAQTSPPQAVQDAAAAPEPYPPDSSPALMDELAELEELSELEP